MKKNRITILGLITLLLLTLTSITACVPMEGEAAGGFDWVFIVFLVVLFALFYFLFIRPQRKRQKEHQQMVGELKRGDNVVTAGGIYGIIESISEDSVVIKVESGATLRVAKGSVAVRQGRATF